MPFAAVAAAAIGAGGAIFAGSQQAGAANKATDAQLEMFHEMQKELQPFVSGGGDALSALLGGLGIGQGSLGAGPLTTPFSWSDFMKSPGYDFIKGQGIDAITNSAAARGGVFGGNTLKALDEFGTGLAAQEYWNARNAYTNDQQNLIKNLLGLTQVGESAGANVGSGAIATGQGIAGTIGASGIANSAGIAGAANSLGNFFNTPGALNFLGNIFGPGGSGTGSNDGSGI